MVLFVIFKAPQCQLFIYFCMICPFKCVTSSEGQLVAASVYGGHTPDCSVCIVLYMPYLFLTILHSPKGYMTACVKLKTGQSSCLLWTRFIIPFANCPVLFCLGFPLNLNLGKGTAVSLCILFTVHRGKLALV